MHAIRSKRLLFSQIIKIKTHGQSTPFLLSSKRQCNQATSAKDTYDRLLVVNVQGCPKCTIVALPS